VTDDVPALAAAHVEMPVVRDTEASFYVREEAGGLLVGPYESNPKAWAVDEMAKELYLAPAPTREILDDLVRQGLIALTAAPETYYYQAAPARDQLVSSVDSTYRRELIRITRLIHSKPSSAVRAFARAFRLKKDPE